MGVYERFYISELIMALPVTRAIAAGPEIFYPSQGKPRV